MLACAMTKNLAAERLRVLARGWCHDKMCIRRWARALLPHRWTSRMVAFSPSSLKQHGNNQSFYIGSS